MTENTGLKPTYKHTISPLRMRARAHTHTNIQTYRYRHTCTYAQAHRHRHAHRNRGTLSCPQITHTYSVTRQAKPKEDDRRQAINRNQNQNQLYWPGLRTQTRNLTPVNQSIFANKVFSFSFPLQHIFSQSFWLLIRLQTGENTHST